MSNTCKGHAIMMNTAHEEDTGCEFMETGKITCNSGDKGFEWEWHQELSYYIDDFYHCKTLKIHKEIYNE